VTKNTKFCAITSLAFDCESGPRARAASVRGRGGRSKFVLKGPCSYLVSAMGTQTLLRYLSEFRVRVFVVSIDGNSRVEALRGTGHLKQDIL